MDFPRTGEEITPEWLTQVLREAYIDHVLPGYLDLVEGHETDGQLE